MDGIRIREVDFTEVKGFERRIDRPYAVVEYIVLERPYTAIATSTYIQPGRYYQKNGIGKV